MLVSKKCTATAIPVCAEIDHFGDRLKYDEIELLLQLNVGNR
jgi:hypothetical protein